MCSNTHKLCYRAHNEYLILSDSYICTNERKLHH